jgi:hypothetical protein
MSNIVKTREMPDTVQRLLHAGYAVMDGDYILAVFVSINCRGLFDQDADATALAEAQDYLALKGLGRVVRFET